MTALKAHNDYTLVLRPTPPGAHPCDYCMFQNIDLPPCPEDSKGNLMCLPPSGNAHFHSDNSVRFVLIHKVTQIGVCPEDLVTRHKTQNRNHMK